MPSLDFATTLTRPQKRAVFLMVDASLAPAALCLAGLSAGVAVGADVVWPVALMCAALFVTAALLSDRLGLTRIKLNSYELKDTAKIGLLAGLLGGAALLLNTRLNVFAGIGPAAIFAMIFLLGAVTARLTMLFALRRAYDKKGAKTRILVYGAGATGQQLAKALQTDRSLEVIAFADDNPTLHTMTIGALKVLSPSAIAPLIREGEIDRIVLCLPSVSKIKQEQLSKAFAQLGCEVHALPSFAQLLTNSSTRPKTPSDATPSNALGHYLGRGQLCSELPIATDIYKGKRILVTGAGGSIGSELCRQLVEAEPRSIVLLDHSELALYTIHKELAALELDVEITPCLGSVTHQAFIEHCLRTHEVDVVLHAAAYKHLPLVQENAIAGLSNNVIGTRILAEAAHRAGVGHFTLVSTDKAVRPTSTMGASKRLAELVVQDLATRNLGTLFSIVRFGNVLGSSGSVVPLFEEQISRGGPVTLTDENVTRYFMTTSEAARLVLLAASYSNGGDLFMLDMGKPVSIAALARQMITASGYSVKDARTPDGDIEIKVTGLREGEKLHEELFGARPILSTPHDKILRVQENNLSEIEIATALKSARIAIDTHNEASARAILDRWIRADAERGDVAQAK